MSFLRADIAELGAQVRDLLSSHPELIEDDRLREDMILGETDVDRIAGNLVRIIGERKARADGLSVYISELQDRKAREMRGVDGARSLLKLILQVANLDKLTLPEATVSITRPRTKAIVNDVNLLPQGFYKREPKLSEIKKALEAGEEIPGAVLALDDDGLLVRTK